MKWRNTAEVVYAPALFFSAYVEANWIRSDSSPDPQLGVSLGQLAHSTAYHTELPLTNHIVMIIQFSIQHYLVSLERGYHILESYGA